MSKIILSIGILASCLFVSDFACAGEPLLVAPGSSMVEYLKQIIPDIEKKQGVTVSLLRDDGISGDSVLLALGLGKADLGFLGNPWDDVMKLVKEKKLEIPGVQEFKHETVGFDRVRFVTYKGGPKEISRAQLKQLFTGKITDWKELGLEPAPVLIVLPSHSQGGQKFVREKVLGGEDFLRHGVKQFTTYRELLTFVGKTKGALSFSPGNVDVAEVNVPTQESLKRDIVAVHRPNSPPAALKVIQALRDSLAPSRE